MARGSTLLNILQQIGGSIGSAIMSVILTSQLNELRPRSPAWSTRAPASRSPRPGVAIATQHGADAARMPAPDVIERGLEFVADSFATTFWVGVRAGAATFIPVAFLPRKQAATPPQAAGEAGDVPAPAVIMH